MAEMRIYTVHINPTRKQPYETPVFIEESFNWWAFIFRGFWALYHKLWLWGILLITVELLMRFLVVTHVIPTFASFFLLIGAQALLGFHANDLRRAKLRKQGYIVSDIVTGDNQIGAEQRFFERYYPTHTRIAAASPYRPAPIAG